MRNEIVVPLLVHADGLLGARRERVDQNGQLVELDVDLLGQVFGLGARRRDAHRDRLADEAHLAVRQRMPLGELVAGHRGRRDHGGCFGQVGPDEHASLAAWRLRDAPDAAVRNRTAQECDFALAGEDHVRDIVAAPAQET